MTENSSETDSTQMLGNWDFSPESEDARTISNPPKEAEKEMKTRVSDKGIVNPSDSAGGSREEPARRVLPPSMHPSYEWGGGKWKEDGRKNKKKKNKNEKEREKEREREKEKEKEKESDEIPFKDIIEALLRNSGEKVEEDKSRTQSYVEMLKAMGFKFP